MTQVAADSSWLSVADTAAQLGVSEVTVYRVFWAGDLPGLRARRTISIPAAFVADVLAAIRAGRQVDLAEFGRQWAAEVSA
jgi:hypothetical protein